MVHTESFQLRFSTAGVDRTFRDTMQCPLLCEHKKLHGQQPHQLLREAVLLSSPHYKGGTCESESFKDLPKVTQNWDWKTCSLSLKVLFLTASVYGIILLMWANVSYLPTGLGTINSNHLVENTSRCIWVFPRMWSYSELPLFLQKSQLFRTREQRRNRKTPFHLIKMPFSKP